MKKIFIIISVLFMSHQIVAQTVEKDSVFSEYITYKYLNSWSEYEYVNTIGLRTVESIAVDTDETTGEGVLNIIRRFGASPFSQRVIEGSFLSRYDYAVKTMYDTVKIEKETYLNTPTSAEVTAAITALDAKLNNMLEGCYCMRGGKESQVPGPHAYQRQYSFGPDGYAQYMVAPHSDFMYGTLTSTYDIDELNSSPLGSYIMAKNAFMPLLSDPMIDYIPEIKAINLLFYCLAAQEMADLSSPFTYYEDKRNCDNPTKYDDLRTIYYGIVNDIDDIVACLENYENRPQWYKDEIMSILAEFDVTNRDLLLEGNMSMNSYIKLANSLKLRMAMHIVKVEPATAKKWAEDAVAGGVIENENEQNGIYPYISGFTHPLVQISNSWGDLVLCASFESLLMSLGHPYADYVFAPNNNDIVNEKEEKVLPKDTRLVGLRAGTLVGTGQVYSVNQYQAYSKFNTETMNRANPPLYFIKWSEVDFLRAEGAIRGWNMGGTAQEFYERGIRNGYMEDPWSVRHFPYKANIEEYIQRETPNDYVNVDPVGDGLGDWESVTKIGVKWNDGDSNETKLEKIITQKYIALFPLSTEAWTEMRRTGYPKVFPVLNTDDGDGSILPG
ncbi:MAG: SusD/RagB family nutrient-binding outer membrane lipoprotein, partial [Bacteroidaceae bacterium]|nr:SusD/RagB family nutrient-binding outer membrane lipoprotein [Bacteroidaceae bacterium]